MATGRAADNFVVPGKLTCGTFAITGSTEIPAANLKHVHRIIWADEYDDGPTSQEFVLYTALYSGTIIYFAAGSVAVATTGSVSIDLHKDAKTAASVLSAPIVLDTGNSNFTPEEGTISSASVSGTDCLVVTIADTSSDEDGLFIILEVVESYD